MSSAIAKLTLRMMPLVSVLGFGTSLYLIPTVSLGVTSAVVSRCGHESGQIEPRVAHEWAGHWATHAGPAERPPHRPPPHAPPLAPGRQPHGRRPRLPPRGGTAQPPPSD